MRRQAEGLSEDGAAMAVEPTQIQLSKRWREIESKFAQFRRLNFAQIVSCYWQTHVCVCNYYSNTRGLLTNGNNNNNWVQFQTSNMHSESEQFPLTLGFCNTSD